MPATDADGKWDRFSAAADRLDDDFDFREIVVYRWVRQYDPDTGDYEYELEEKTRVRAEVQKPTTPITTTGPEGGEAEVDLEVYLPPEAPGVIPAGENERATVLEDTLDGRMLTVTERFTEDSGLVKVSTVER